MLTDYMNQYYIPQAKRAEDVKADDFRKAREMAAWKKHVRRSWDDVQVLSRTEPQTSYDISEKNPLHSEIVLNLGDLRPEYVGVELVFAQTDIPRHHRRLPGRRPHLRQAPAPAASSGFRVREVDLVSLRATFLSFRAKRRNL